MRRGKERERGRRFRDLREEGEGKKGKETGGAGRERKREISLCEGGEV